ncbi:hypothetical protein TCAL_00792 [Tigriopus californicus]|uniref:DNA mismatch repair protein MSH3 n=1 Tax=Tigriopus californicus TaxID=6832 RepID=A0A553NC48_TIGCA|nr:DNA mismatch repair protein Msh3-like [Tigriopus californicus]TRY63020.1 hypothetical protein TCAL_00792 [Tigriopus californicus]|eukprot:TCALIF_00792-PA protein Name:"Similar to MSH3 DNA mismatch repair protein Msh3 (Homo sapiens)" AED:0.02 eAED:0.02 QI:0/-1/0/1/-1/1/1/0/992
MVGGGKGQSKYFFGRKKTSNTSTSSPTSNSLTNSPRTSNTKSQRSIDTFFKRKSSSGIDDATPNPESKTTVQDPNVDWPMAKKPRIYSDGTQQVEEVIHVDEDRETCTSLISDTTPTDLKSQPPESTVQGKPTPLEKQVIEFKAKYPQLILFVECGYRYRFFGRDAEIAAKVLGIYCHQDRLFLTASVPTFHGPALYVKKLVAHGYKVGIIGQTETAAARQVGNNKSSSTFARDLVSIYSRSTFLGEDISLEYASELTQDPKGNVKSVLMAVYETDASIAVVGVEPTTGNIIYDDFKDDPARCGLAMRLATIEPCEVLVPRDLLDSKSQTILDMYCRKAAEKNPIIPETVDIDRFDNGDFIEFFGDASNALQSLPQLSVGVQRCLVALVHYLAEFNLQDVLKRSKSIEQFSGSRNQIMCLPAMTVRNLELFRNSTSKKSGVQGSLFKILNRTRSRFGARLFKDWLAAPLITKEGILARQASVEYLMSPEGKDFEAVSNQLKKSMDLEMALMASLYQRIKPGDFFRLCSFCHQFWKICTRLISHNLPGSSMPTLIRDAIQSVTESFEAMEAVINSLDEEAAKKSDFVHVFKDWNFLSTVAERKRALTDLEMEMENYRQEIKKILRLSTFQYTTVSGAEYLIEVKRKENRIVPDDWITINSTKYLIRYRSPFIHERIPEIQFAKEALESECKLGWKSFLQEFASRFPEFQKAIKSLALLDCLFSLAEVSKSEGFCRPVFYDDADEERQYSVLNSRNVVLEHILPLGTPVVPNDIYLKLDGPRAVILTGPNMGGKSSYIRQVAQVALMAQMGCHVPGTEARMPLFDGIFLRLGAKDDMFSGQSTLMVELDEANHVMNSATSRSLVLLDELGRGTATLDGAAIAQAVLDHLLLKVQCLTIFVTHYKELINTELRHPGLVKNYHMGFSNAAKLDAKDDMSDKTNTRNIVLLLKLTEGASESSFGMNVARLAGISESIIARAEEMAAQFHSKVTKTCI